MLEYNLLTDNVSPQSGVYESMKQIYLQSNYSEGITQAKHMIAKVQVQIMPRQGIQNTKKQEFLPVKNNKILLCRTWNTDNKVSQR